MAVITNNTAFSPAWRDRIQKSGVIATVILEDPDAAVPLANALCDGGVDCIELTLRTEGALEALRRMASEVPRALVGAGTVLTPQQVHACVEAGAKFGVAPGTNPRVVQEAQSAGWSFAPGVCTPSDVERALELGCTLLKFFPCEPCGGLPYLRSMAAPFTHLGVQFVPLGGIDEHNAASYLGDPLVPAIGGSWLAPKNLIQQRDWESITSRARAIRELIDRTRGGNS
jgi:2-dehydro-3-deoxyphosphogluconate aldolase/(4S)-4-hydroxy-2-oxoglutarate aldolase